MDRSLFLPVSRQDMTERDWYYYDYLVVTGDAYVDHPSFGPAVIARVLENAGYRVAVLAQPDWKNADAFREIGCPRYGVMIGSGNIDSMVAHYTASKKKRSEDFYSPGRLAGRRPDRAVIVYAKLAREAFGADVPIIIGGLEASLRRFAHYDYWDDRVRPSVLFDAGADLLIYGMGERTVRLVADRLRAGRRVLSELTDIPGTAFAVNDAGAFLPSGLLCPSFEDVTSFRRTYAEATKLQYEEHDPVRGKTLIQKHGNRYLIVLPPATPLSREELDAAAELPYTREAHPDYDALGGVPALDEVRFSIIHNRGCFGSCNFCSLTWHQGRMVTSRSEASIVREAQILSEHKDFKGYIHDVGGPTANFRHYSCKDQEKRGMCKQKNCLTPTPCAKLDSDHSEYLKLLRRLRSLPRMKKVFVRSGIRYDYLLEDKGGEFFTELVEHHISGQLKVAPEHCIDHVLDFMGKPHFDVYLRFMEMYENLNKKYGKNQFIVPYLMSSHPGSTLADAVALAEYLHSIDRTPEQVQDFYPTPGTISTCMYHTGYDPMTMTRVYVAKTQHEKELQRALLQFRNPEKRSLVAEALYKANRPDLIGHDPRCLIRPPSKVEQTNAKGSGKLDKSGKFTTRSGAGKSSGFSPKGGSGTKPKPTRLARQEQTSATKVKEERAQAKARLDRKAGKGTPDHPAISTSKQPGPALRDRSAKPHGRAKPAPGGKNKSTKRGPKS